jgi:hypothetical protein
VGPRARVLVQSEANARPGDRGARARSTRRAPPAVAEKIAVVPNGLDLPAPPFAPEAAR